MSNYDFQSLSPRDFEMLSKQLLQKHLGIHFEVFKEGKDQGIDLLRATGKKSDVIVQCKRLAPHALARLMTEVKKEATKAEKHKPKRYILTTSVKLSKANKEEILSMLAPYCVSTSDIFGNDDINALLTEHPDVEKANFKLWLTSAAVLEKVVAAKIANFSEFGADYIKKQYSKFVSNRGVPRVTKVLNEHHYCIIAGKPGIGKTTLAHVLLSQFINDGYEMVSITHDIEEAWSVYNPDKKCIYYYDDFLGQTTLDTKLEKNEDDRLLKFIKAINTNKKSFFLLTTREYILNQASMIYERLGRDVESLEKCIIELEDYSKINKAEILHNHIYFSDLEMDKRLKLLEPSLYKKLLNHQNYYPRLIEDITDRKVLKGCTAEDVPQVVEAYFDNPATIWLQAFHAMSHKAQTLLLVLTTFPENALSPELEEAFNRTFQYFSSKRGWKQGLNDYKGALYELDVSPVQVTKARFATAGRATESITENYIVEFENPSIRDFLENYLCENGEIVKDLFNTSVYFEQAAYLLNLEVGQKKQNLLRHLYPLSQNVLIHWYKLLPSSLSHIGTYQAKDGVVYYTQQDLCDAHKMARIVSKLAGSQFQIEAATMEDCLNDFFIAFGDRKGVSAEGMVRLGDEIIEKKSILIKSENYLSPLTSRVRQSAFDFDDLYNASNYLFDEEADEEMVERVYQAADEQVAKVLRSEETDEGTLSELLEKVEHFSFYHSISLRDLERKLEDAIEDIRRNERDYEEEGYRGGRISSGYRSEPIDFRNREDIEIDEMFDNLKSALVS